MFHDVFKHAFERDSNGFKHGFSNRFINTSKGNWHGITKDSNMDPKADSKRILDGFKKDQKQTQQ